MPFGTRILKSIMLMHWKIQNKVQMYENDNMVRPVYIPPIERMSGCVWGVVGELFLSVFYYIHVTRGMYTSPANRS